jgi:hypothetical protein
MLAQKTSGVPLDLARLGVAPGADGASGGSRPGIDRAPRPPQVRQKLVTK